MISSELKDVMKRLTILNENNKGVLIREESIRDIDNTINIFLKKYEDRFYEGLRLFNKMDITTISSSENSDYTIAFYNLLTGIRGIIDCFGDFDDILVELNKNFMYQSGEITKEEWESSGEVVLDDEENEFGDWRIEIDSSLFMLLGGRLMGFYVDIAELQIKKLRSNTWNHHEDLKTLQEVNKSIHAEFTHRGGVSLKKGK